MCQIHEPYKSRDFTIEEVIAENLKLRQRVNTLEKHYIRKLLRAEATKDKAVKELRESHEDYDLLLKDYVKVRQQLNEVNSCKR